MEHKERVDQPMIQGPCKFAPIFTERLWGGAKLKQLYNKDLPSDKLVGESWELVDLPEHASIVTTGQHAGLTLRQLLELHGSDFGFSAEQATAPFGLMVKFLDAADVLSVQVHPDEQAAAQFPDARPKSECWYVLHAEPGAVIYRDLKPHVERDHVRDALKSGNFKSLLQPWPAKPGDFHFLPAGTVHALGAGIVVAEIQTPSDTTFRLYDWDRRDAQGNSRQLHIDQALASIHYPNAHTPSSSPARPSTHSTDPDSHLAALMDFAGQIGQADLLTTCPYFNVVRLTVPTTGHHELELPVPTVFITLTGSGHIATAADEHARCSYTAGDTLLGPIMKPARITVQQPTEWLLATLGPQRPR